MSSGRIKQIDHIEAYRAAALGDDPHKMTGRGAHRAHTEFVNANITRRLQPVDGLRVADIGCGDGSLLASFAPQISAGIGIVPTAEEVAKLEAVHALANVAFRRGFSTELPVEDRWADLVVINSLIFILPSLADVRTTLKEAARICRPGARVWIGEVITRAAKRKYYGSSALGFILYETRRRGWRGFRSAIRDLTAGSPIVLKPPQLAVPQADFVRMAADAGLRLMDWHVHESLDEHGQAHPSDSRMNFLFEKTSG